MKRTIYIKLPKWMFTKVSRFIIDTLIAETIVILCTLLIALMFCGGVVDEHYWGLVWLTLFTLHLLIGSIVSIGLLIYGVSKLIKYIRKVTPKIKFIEKET